MNRMDGMTGGASGHAISGPRGRVRQGSSVDSQLRVPLPAWGPDTVGLTQGRRRNPPSDEPAYQLVPRALAGAVR